MRRRNVLSIALIFAVATSAAASEIDFLQLLLQRRAPRFDSLPNDEDEPEMTEGREAVEWRLSTMRDDNGRIEPGAILRANLHRRDSLRAQKRGRISSDAASVAWNTWVSRGPQNVGGRTRALLVDPLDNQVLYAGAATGGIWKSTDAGVTWMPLNDFMGNLAISALAFDPLNSNVIYAGTGERHYDREFDVQGAGIFRSVDGGSSWTALGNAANWSYVSAIAPQPGSSETLLASTDKGIYRTTNHGVSWSLVTAPSLIRAIAVAFDPTNGMKAVACIEHPAADPVNTVLDMLYSIDGGLTFLNATGATFTARQDQLPEIALAYAPSSPSKVYIVYGEGSNIGVRRSLDGGHTYAQRSPANTLSEGCTFFERCNIWIAPDDPELVVIAGLHVMRSIDGGTSFAQISYSDQLLPVDRSSQGLPPLEQPHADQHCIVSGSTYSSANRVIYLCTDGGVFRANDILAANISVNDTAWKSRTLTYQTTQFYSAIGHVSGAGAYVGGAQDNGALATTSSSNTATVAMRFGDGGFVEIDPHALNTWYLGQIGDTHAPTIWRSFDGGEPVDIATFADVTLFVPPFILDPNDSNTLLFGGTKLWRSTNAAAPTVNWTSIRPGTLQANAISAIAVAPGNSNLVWVAQNGAVVQKTTNGTAASPIWTDVDNNSTLNPLPPRYVTRILIDPSDHNTVYVALGGYVSGNLLKTTDGGATFTSISGSGVSALPPAPVRAIARHPRNAQRLYAGTDLGLYESENGGATWSTSHAGPADVTIDDLRFLLATAPGNEVLIAATHGRGLWTHDVSSVPTLNPTVINMTFNATASSNTTVSLTWNGVTGATSYDILRKTAAGITTIPVGAVTSYSDSVSSATSYLYKVKAFAGTTLIGESTFNLATTVMFTDDNALLNKVILTTHMQELRTAVNAVRALNAALSPLNSTNLGKVLAQDLNDLRGGLNEVFPTIGFPAPFSGTININALIVPSDFQTIRDAVK